MKIKGKKNIMLRNIALPGSLLCYCRLSCHLQYPHPQWQRVHILTSLLPTQIPVNVLWKIVDDLSAWAPATHMRNLHRAPVSWIWLDP